MAKVNSKIVVIIILVVVAVLLAGISSSISGIISLRLKDGDTKRRLLAISALCGFGFLWAIATAVVGILYARARASGAKNARVLGIVFAILAIMNLLVFITVVSLLLVTRNRDDLKVGDKRALLASVFLISGSFVALLVGTILIFTTTKGLSGSEAKAALSVRKRPAMASPTAVADSKAN